MTSTPIVPGRYIARQFQGEASVAGNITANGQSIELNVQGNNTVAYFISGTWTGTLQFEYWNGNGWTGMQAAAPYVTVASTGTQTTTNGVRTATITGFDRIRIVAVAAITGTANIVIRASQGLSSAPYTGVVGAVIRGATIANPVVIGLRAATAAPTNVTNGLVVDPLATQQGHMIVRPWQIPELTWSYASATGGIINTADVAIATAAGAGLRRYITDLNLSNNSATATEVVLKDGASTVLQRWMLPANAINFNIRFSNPPLTTANTALNIACITTGAAVYANATGFTAP